MTTRARAAAAPEPGERARTTASAGTLAAAFRWPVKSMRGERVDLLEFAAHGAAGDRAYALVDRGRDGGRLLTAREAPRMLLWSAAYPSAVDALDPPEPGLTGPAGETFGWSDPRLPDALADDLGRPVERRREPTGQPDLAGLVLVTTEGSRRALEAQLGGDVVIERFRPNLHLDLDAPAWAERRWLAARIEIEGGPSLEIVQGCERCAIPTRDPETAHKWPDLLRWLARERDTLFGVYARVVDPGVARAGARVQVTP